MVYDLPDSFTTAAVLDNSCPLTQTMYPEVAELVAAKAELSTTRTFASYNLTLGNEDVQTIEQFHISKPKIYFNFNDFDGLSEGIKAFFEYISPNNITLVNSMSNLVVRLVSNAAVVLSDQGTGFLAGIVAGVSSDNFREPRWHTDSCLEEITDDMPINED